MSVMFMNLDLSVSFWLEGIIWLDYLYDTASIGEQICGKLIVSE